MCTKLSILGGDLFFSKACYCLSCIEIPSLVDIMSCSITYLSLKHSSAPKNRIDGSNIIDFLAYVNWRYVDLIIHGIRASSLMMLDSQKITKNVEEFIKIITEYRVLIYEVNYLLKYSNLSGIYTKNNSRLASYYPQNSSIDLIVSEATSAYQLRKQSLIKIYSSIYPLFDHFELVFNE
ncbi:hypothetical protein HZS_256 [Henneguya salminicola]|nr:hypothetical protein HZS_256 [Henneguya salminicola]